MVMRVFLIVCLMSNVVAYSSHSKPKKREECSLKKVLVGAIVGLVSLKSIGVEGCLQCAPKPAQHCEPVNRRVQEEPIHWGIEHRIGIPLERLNDYKKSKC